MCLLIPGLLAATAEDADIPVSALSADEECAVGPDGKAPACALNALQRNAQQKAAGGDEAVAEASAVNATAAQASESDDAEEPEAFVELEEAEDDGLEAESVEELDSVEEEHDSSKDAWGRRRSSSSSSTRKKNKCCKCYDKTVSWSASGTCSHCQKSGIFKAVAPPTKCQKGSSQWNGKDPSWPQHCAKECAKLLAKYTPSPGGNHHGTSPGTCKIETGGSCKFFGCKKSRGPHVKCVKRKCVCTAGTCANRGRCV